MTRLARMLVPLSVASIATLGTACTHSVRRAPETSVAFRMNGGADTPHYDVREDESSNSPVPIENEPPVYPPGAIALRLPLVLVAAKVIVGEDGKVREIRIAPVNDDPSRQPFEAAVRAAVSRWAYVPLTFARFEDVIDAQGNVVDSRPVSIERRPFSLDYEIRFELRDGKPVVDARSRAGGSP